VRAFVIGLDLGREQDFSAMSVVEYVNAVPAGTDLARWMRRADEVRTARLYGNWDFGRDLPPARKEWHVRHLQRWPLGTRYIDVVADIGRFVRSGVFEQPEDSVYLIADRTGVGYVVEELLTVAYRRGDLPLHCWPVFATLTAAEEQNNPSPAHWNIPKKDVISSLQVGLQNGVLKVAAGIPLGDVLEREFTAYRMKITASGRASYDIARREGEGHGDLLMATGLALQFSLPWHRLIVGTHEA